MADTSVCDTGRAVEVETTMTVATPSRPSLKRQRVGPPDTVFQKLHLMSRNAPIDQYQCGPRKQPKVTSLLTPARLAIDLGKEISICDCTEKICQKERNSNVSGCVSGYVIGSRRLCGRPTEEHGECHFFREMTKRFSAEAPASQLDCRLDHHLEAMGLALKKLTTSAFLLRGTQVVGYISIITKFAHNFTLDTEIFPDLSEAARQQVNRSLFSELPLLMQIYVEKEYRKTSVCSQALRRAFQDKDALLVNGPSPPIAKVLKGLGFVCAAFEKVTNQYDELLYVQVLYVRPKDAVGEEAA